MDYTPKQIERAQREYNSMLRIHTLSDYRVQEIGINEAEQRMAYHNNIVTEIRNGNKESAKQLDNEKEHNIQT